MGENSNISWCSDTFNGWIGCTRLSPACTHCYAAELDKNRFSKMLGEATKEHPVSHWGPGASRIRTSADNWKKPHRWNKRPFVCNNCGQDSKDQEQCSKCGLEYFHRRRVFSLSLGDWLDEEVPIEWLADMLRVIHETPNLTWLLLTKRPENFPERIKAVLDMDRIEEDGFMQWLCFWQIGQIVPKNVHIGVTVENQHYADLRIPQLLAIPAHRRFLSCEPLLGPISLPLCFHESSNPNQHDHSECAPIVDQVIVGGESGSEHRPLNLEWMRSIKEQCNAAGTAYFCKQDSGPRAGQRGRIPDDLWAQEATR